MNLQLANVLTDISGATGQAIIKAILAGERNPHKLAALRDYRVKANEQQIAQYLEGNWQEDLLFVLKQEQEAYQFCQQQMAACDRQLEQYFQGREDRSRCASLPEERRKAQKEARKVNIGSTGPSAIKWLPTCWIRASSLTLSTANAAGVICF